MMKVFVTTLLASCSGLQLAGEAVRKRDAGDSSSLWLGDPPAGEAPAFPTKVRDEAAKGFPSRNVMLPFRDRITALSRAASSNPCAAEVLTGGFGMKAGFGARVMLAVSEIQLAVYFNKSFAICDGDSQQPGIAWETYFDNPAGLSVCPDPVQCLKSETMAAWTGNGMVGQLKLVDAHFQTSLLQTITHSLVAYDSRTRSRAHDALRDAGLEDGAQYIGVHMRRGDKLVEARRVPSNEYATLVREKLLELQISVVFVASDDAQAGKELLAALQAALPSVRVLQLFSDGSDTRNRYHDDDDTTMALLTDIFALSRAKVFIGTQSSSMSRLVRFFRNPDASSISVDGDWLDFYE